MWKLGCYNFKGWQSKVDQMSKLSSSQGCIRHMNWLGQTLGRKGPKAGRLAKLLGRPTMFYVSLAHGFEDTCLHEEYKAKAVEAAPPGRPATTWHQTNFSKSVELPHGPINTPSPLRWKWGHTPHFGDSTCKALILSVIARRSFVKRVARLWGLEGLPAYREPSS
jgi:hypothetical protein